MERDRERQRDIDEVREMGREVEGRDGKEGRERQRERQTETGIQRGT